MSAIGKVILWSNGLVMVFDVTGNQMAEYQGRRCEAVKELKKADLSEAGFEIGDWRNGTVPTNAECFFSQGWGDDAD